MGKIIAVGNQKGGVGKTTTCVNLSAALTELGSRVLVCDLDPQSNATSGLGVDKTGAPSAYHVVMGQAAANRAIVKTKWADVLPSNKDLSGATVELVEVERRELQLRKALIPLKADYDYIFVDCPPSLELLTLNAFCAADSLLVPVQCEYYALEGIADLCRTIRMIQKSLNPSLELEGVLLTMFDGRTNLSAQVSSEIRRYFYDKVYQTTIPRNVRLSEAPSYGKPALELDSRSRGAVAYRAVAKELLDRNLK